MKLLLPICIIGILFASCRKDEFSCRIRSLVGQYYTDGGIPLELFLKDYYKDELWTDLPKIGSFNNFWTRTQFKMNGCSFTFVLSDNYGESANGPHYYMSGQGKGRFEGNRLILEYDLEVKARYSSEWPAEYTILKDAKYDYIFIKE